MVANVLCKYITLSKFVVASLENYKRLIKIMLTYRLLVYLNIRTYFLGTFVLLSEFIYNVCISSCDNK